MEFLGRRSAWTWKTSESLNGGYGIYAAEKGDLILVDPDGQQVDLSYGGFGVGPGIGVKLPKAVVRWLKGQIERELSGGIGPLSFNSSGTIFLTVWCQHPELTRDDFRGGCIFGEISLGLIESNSATAFLVGINPSALSMLARANFLDFTQISQILPKALILAKGSGIGVGLGVDLFTGAVSEVENLRSSFLVLIMLLAFNPPAVAQQRPSDTPDFNTRFRNMNMSMEALLNAGYKINSVTLGIDSMVFVLSSAKSWATCSLRNGASGSQGKALPPNQMASQCFSLN